MERVLDQPAQQFDDEEVPSLRAQVEALVETVAQEGEEPVGRGAASRLKVALEALARAEPTRGTRDFLQGLLDRRTLDGLKDAQGLPCRGAVVSAQLALGYPYALEISPEDLQALRDAGRPQTQRGLAARVLTGLSASVSLLWNGWMAAMLMANLGRTGEVAAWYLAPLLIGAGHGLVALVQAAGASTTRSDEERQRSARTLKVLGWMFSVGPAASVIAELVNGHGAFFFGLIAAAPAMVTALLCAVTAAQVAPDGEPAPVEPLPVEAAP